MHERASDFNGIVFQLFLILPLTFVFHNMNSNTTRKNIMLCKEKHHGDEIIDLGGLDGHPQLGGIIYFLYNCLPGSL